MEVTGTLSGCKDIESGIISMYPNTNIETVILPKDDTPYKVSGR